MMITIMNVIHSFEGWDLKKLVLRRRRRWGRRRSNHKRIRCGKVGHRMADVMNGMKAIDSASRMDERER